MQRYLAAPADSGSGIARIALCIPSVRIMSRLRFWIVPACLLLDASLRRHRAAVGGRSRVRLTKGWTRWPNSVKV